jgi:hypothetical protein
MALNRFDVDFDTVFQRPRIQGNGTDQKQRAFNLSGYYETTTKGVLLEIDYGTVGKITLNGELDQRDWIIRTRHHNHITGEIVEVEINTEPMGTFGLVNLIPDDQNFQGNTEFVMTSYNEGFGQCAIRGFARADLRSICITITPFVEAGMVQYELFYLPYDGDASLNFHWRDDVTHKVWDENVEAYNNDKENIGSVQMRHLENHRTNYNL